MLSFRGPSGRIVRMPFNVFRSGFIDSASRFAAYPTMTSHLAETLHSNVSTEMMSSSLSLGADGGAQLFHDFAGGLACRILLRDFERNGTHPGVSAAAVSFADLGQVHHRLRGRPRI